jgi:DNA-binding beta-propeller fold protein YncE
MTTLSRQFPSPNLTRRLRTGWRFNLTLAAAALLFASAPPLIAAENVLYVTSNKPAPGKNAVLAYQRNPSTGALTFMGKILTGGTGFYNDDERLGPDDSDQEMIASPDGRLLFAVNSGSNSVAVFKIQDDGNLVHVPGSPFDSGGVQPVSLGLAGDRLYVVNKGDLEPGETDGDVPNYTAFKVSANGRLRPIPNSTVELPPGSHPTQALISPGGNLLFGVELFTFKFTPPPGFPPFVPPFASALEAFRIESDGRLTRGPNSPLAAPLPPPFPPFTLGLQVHPTEPYLYVGFVVAGQLGTYRYDASGALTFIGATPSSGMALCWIEVNKAGAIAYSSNSGDNSVSVYSLQDPAHPVEKQKVDLKKPKKLLNEPGPNQFTTTPFQLQLDPAGKFLYVVNHETTLADTFPKGNALHILKVARDGTLTEIEDSPVILPRPAVPAGAHPKGIVVF